MKIIKIKLEMQDWLYNAGIVGFSKILIDNDIVFYKDRNYIEFDANILEDFNEMYFNYFIKKYKKFTSWYEIVSFEDFINSFNKNDFDEKSLKLLNDKITYIKGKLILPSYKKGYQIIEDKSLNLLEEEKKLKEIKINKKQSLNDVIEDVENQIFIIKNIINYLNKDGVKKIIIAKNVIYDIINKFWSDVCFLNKNDSEKNMYDDYKSYFINDMFKYVNSNKENFKYNCFTCNSKINGLNKPDSYDLAWINKIGVDMSRKTSHFWNFNGDAYICPICNLIYSCIPAGFTVIYDKGLFINENSSIENLISINRHTIDKETTIEQLEQESYYNIINIMEQTGVDISNKEIENVQIIKFDSQNEIRPYTFNILSKDVIKLISKNKNRLKALIKIKFITGKKDGKDIYANLYNEVLKRLYNSQNQFDLIQNLLTLNLTGDFNNLNCIEIIIKINNDFIGGCMEDKKVSDKQIWKIRQIGFELKKAYIDKKSKNKLNGISYRLLNALKTNDISKYMNTIINSYMYLGDEIPTFFIEALKDKDVFQTIGYSFLLGLQGEELVINEKSNMEVEKL